VKQAYQVLDKRRAGILLHPTSLPGSSDHGDLGHQAYRFIEFLSAAGISMWQMLPLGPTHEDGSPYQCLSVHAGNPLLISLDWLVDRGWLATDSIKGKLYSARMRMAAIEEAFANFCNMRPMQAEFQAFLQEHSEWLQDYALFMAIRKQQGDFGWISWPLSLRDRDPAALDKARKALQKSIEQIYFEQFVFFQQWHELKRYAHQHGVLLFGDMPIFVAHDSAEVWAHRQYFTVDEHGNSITVAGVPPDYFSATGQRWGNPLYHWSVMQADGFHWWEQRMRTQLSLFDIVRIDHFRGFEAYWEIPATAETAIDGRWVRAPGEELLDKLHEVFSPLPLIAEDLGTITEEVEQLRKRFEIPGMKILQFAFDGGPANPYLPHNFEEYCVAYTGTHDNDTTLSWFQSLPVELQNHVRDYLGHSEEAMPWPMIRAVLASVARLCILPMQDLMGLGEGNRMNTPGTLKNNWAWRFHWEQVPDGLTSKVHHLVRLYGR
jgi:4-alpha-glucanotransferase